MRRRRPSATASAAAASICAARLAGAEDGLGDTGPPLALPVHPQFAHGEPEEGGAAAIGPEAGEDARVGRAKVLPLR